MNAMVALDRCRRAWERTSPQLVIDGWLDMLDELDAPQPSALRFVEPVVPCLPRLPDGGLNPGAEPCCGTPDGLTASSPRRGRTRWNGCVGAFTTLWPRPRSLWGVARPGPDRSLANVTSLEAIVVMDTDEFIVPCPYCDESHTHKESCRLSQTNTGNVYVIVAKRTGIRQPDHLRQGASS